MHTFAQKPKAIPGRGHFGQSHEVRSILRLQRTIGNQAMQRNLQADTEQPEVGLTGPASPRFGHDFSRIPIHPPAAGAIQTKLAINKLGDSYEQEADRMAEQVMRTPEPQLQRACRCGGGCPKCLTEQPDREQESLQIKRVQASDPGQIAAPPTVHEVLRSPGQPLDPATRAFMEPRFGYDFSRVRVHSGPAAEQSAQRVEANAYAVGHHVVFGAGRFAPGTHEGRRLIAHELVHVLQQHDHDPKIQRQPQPSANLLTPAGAAAAVADVTRRYDEDSIRAMEHYSSQTPDGVFDADDAEAIAKLQQMLRLTPNGKVNVPLLDAMLRMVGRTAAARSAMIHLVVDHANLDVSGALAVVYDPATTASDRDTFPGGVSTIQIGNASFSSYRVMVAEIRKQLAARPAASPVTRVPATVLTDPTIQGLAITLNKNMLNDRRSIKLLQGALGSRVTGHWDVDLVRHVAAKQQALGLTPSGGILFDSTLAAIGTEMIANGSQDAVLQLMVDYYDLDPSHAFNIVFDQNPPPTHMTAEAQTMNLGGVGTPGVVHVYPRGFAQPFAGLVHTVAHELGHIQQIIQGVGSLNVREFLSEGIEIESRGLPTESIESDADIDLMIRNTRPVHAGFIQDVDNMFHWWSQMTPGEKQAQHQRYKDLRTIIVTRIATQGSATQKTKLAPFVALLNNADNGVP